MAALASAAWALVTLISGGFVLRAGRVTLASHDPLRAAIVALVLGLVARMLLSREEFSRLVRRVAGSREGWPSRLAVIASMATLVFAIAWNTRAAGGSDSSCYVLQADAFAHGHATLSSPLAALLPTADPALFAPTGFIPSRVSPPESVPICGSGLALAMAAASVIGGERAVFLVVPLCAALSVWLTFALGRRLDDDVTGAAAALLLACSPIFLYQAVQPMSDVPAVALVLALVVLLATRDADGAAWRERAAGACAALAVMTRPSLAIAVLPALVMLRSVSAWMRFSAGALPGAAALVWLNIVRYGSPLASGYGDTGVLFAAVHVLPNLERYPRWLLATQSPFVALSLLAPWWISGDRERFRVRASALGVTVLVVAPYLAYTVFDDWWYIRFLLPALPFALVFSVGIARGALRRLPSIARTLVASGAMLLLVAWSLHVGRARQVFDLQRLEARFPAGAREARAVFPADTVFLAVQQGGSLRYHGRRATLAWDAIARDGLDATIDALRRRGRPAVIALEDAEEPAFRARFSGQRFGALDWAPADEVHGAVLVRFYDPRTR